MSAGPDLDHHLKTWAGQDPIRHDVAVTLSALARAARAISELVGQGALAGPLGAATGKCGPTDEQKNLDLIAHGTINEVLRGAPVALLLSEEAEAPIVVNPSTRLLVAVDPIDGSSNIDTGTTIGTIFSILPAGDPGIDTDPAASLHQSGSQQLAAGFFIYGSFTALALTVGQGTHLFTLDRVSGRFLTTASDVQIPAETSEYAINASNQRHWDRAVRIYVDDCLRGRDGPRGKDFNMRWTASPVADVYRILTRGGIFLYPGDLRDGYHNGRLRLIYEANPLAFVIEQAGGAAASGESRILNIVPRGPHEHTPIIAGSREEVAYVVRLHLEPQVSGEASPLFGRRGLFRV